MSEAGASLVDQKLGLNVVPKTRVEKLDWREDYVLFESDVKVLFPSLTISSF